MFEFLNLKQPHRSLFFSAFCGKETCSEWREEAVLNISSSSVTKRSTKAVVANGVEMMMGEGINLIQLFVNKAIKMFRVGEAKVGNKPGKSSRKLQKYENVIKQFKYTSNKSPSAVGADGNVSFYFGLHRWR